MQIPIVVIIVPAREYEQRIEQGFVLRSCIMEFEIFDWLTIGLIDFAIFHSDRLYRFFLLPLYSTCLINPVWKYNMKIHRGILLTNSVISVILHEYRKIGADRRRSFPPV